MEHATYDEFGGWSLVVRPQPVSCTRKKIRPTGHLIHLKLKVIQMKKFALIPAAFIASVGAAQAAVPSGVTDAITTAGTDAQTIGAAVLVVIVGIFALKLIKRAL